MTRVIHSLWPWQSCLADDAPGQVGGLTATPSGQTTINLQWNADTTAAPNTATAYEVERSVDGLGSWTLIGTVAVPTVTFSDTTLSASTTRHYRVRATNCNSGGLASTSASATTAAGSISPSWTLDFSTGTPSGYTLTRASTGTYVDSSGYIASASTNVARLTHNSSGSRLGLLVEGQRTNRAPNSILLDANYTLSGGVARTTQTAISTPRGASVSASKITGSALGGAGSAFYYTENTLANGNYTLSIYAKADGANFLYLFIADNAADHGRYFDLSNGTLGNTTGTPTSSSITDAGNGWYRCAVSVNNTSGATHYPALLPSTTNATGRASQAGTSPNGILVTAIQFEAAASPSSWIETTSTTTVTRSADLAHVLDSSITSWGDPGALVVHFYPPGQAGTLISTDDASTAQVGIEASTTTAARAFWSSGSTATGTIGSGVQKAVHYWTGSTSKFCINGGTVQSGTNNLTIGNTDFVTLGAEATDSAGVPSTFSQYANCVIRKVEFYSGSLTDANLQTITT